jgi:hypothetical protein
MNAIKYFLSISLLLLVVTGCKKETFDDVSFINNLSDPAKISVLFDITQDNTGLVTITPNGEGVSTYDVYYGDGSQTFVKVAAGKNVQHKYAEGVYSVKIVGHGVSGKTAEATQSLTVSFKAPENLKTTITTNGLAVTVAATAQYETMFHVYYGDATTANPEPYDSFLEGQTATHNYPSAGTYTIRVVALSGGVATTMHEETVKVGKQIDLPLTFDDPNFDYTMSDFGNNQSAVSVDPANNANKVLKVTKPTGAEVWAGTTLGTATGFATKIPVSAVNSKMTMRIYSPAAGLTIKLKLEEHANGKNSVETDVKTTVANKWETLTFDFKNNSAGTPALNAAFNYDKASVFFDFNVAGNGKVFYMDDLMMAIQIAQISLPVTFDGANINYTVTDFGNNVTVDATDPNNATNNVKKTTKPNGAEVWAGTTIGTPAGFSAKVPVTAAYAKMSMRVYSPAAGLHVRLKIEDHTNGNISVETEAITTVANQWETLTFDFTSPAAGTPALNAANNYDKASVFFDFGNVGNGKVFYWDDVKSVPAPSSVLGIPLDFQSTTLKYTFTDFEGGAVTVVDNPLSADINTSTKVAKMVKNAGATYAGSYITLDGPIDFTKKIFKMKVLSPKVGAKVLLKVENLTDGSVSFEKEVLTTKANAWEELTFDYTGINTAKSYQKVVLIFDNGNVGDGSANFTYYFDDITLN